MSSPGPVPCIPMGETLSLKSPGHSPHQMVSSVIGRAIPFNSAFPAPSSFQAHRGCSVC
jgi:hypothetical protein